MVNTRITSIASAAAVSRLVLVTLVTSHLLSPIAADAFHKLPSVSVSASSTQRFGIRHIRTHNLQKSHANLNANVLHIRGGDAGEEGDTEVHASASNSNHSSENEDEVRDLSGPPPSINHTMELEAEDILDDADTDEYDYESEYDSQEDEEAGDMSGSGHGNDLRDTSASSIDMEVMIQEEANCIERENDLTEINVANAQENASQLRIKGKEFHDAGDFDKASETFQKAAIELEGIISTLKVSTDMHIDIELSKQLTEERATCRLHEALCHLKNKKYAESIASCTSVLMDGVEVIVVDSSDDDDDYVDSSEEDEVSEQSQSKSSIVRINASDDDSASSDIAQLSPAVKARAYHRRAKARLALGDTAGALDDSRSAAFLGDRNAVALYGRLMRESGGAGGGSPFDGGSGMNGLFGSSSSSPFDSIFSGGSPFSEGTSDSPLGSGSMGMLSSLLSSQGSSGGSSGQPAIPFNPLSMMASMNGSNSDGGGMGGLAKSVLSSVAKKAEDKDMQETVCKYLNALDASQIISLSSMAGMPLNQSTAERLVSFANGVTPRGIGRTVKLTKRILFVGALMRKIFKIIGKYKHLLVLVVLIGWTKSAIQRPIVIKKVVKKAVEATTSKSAFSF
mmetsp:Transcript_14584/g.21894  ORF Transcript_14584/g.21894 Transcript_14584/m.21894 type:complete len:624 (+) Transcript_14584:141-2012(+)